MKFGDAVVYIENGVEFNATVLGVRVLDHHTGANDEPLLHLGFFKEAFGQVIGKDESGEEIKRPLVGTQNQGDLVQFRLDVAHDSHEFNDEVKKNLNTTTYPGGRWKEVEISTFTGSQLADEEEES